MPTLTVFTKSAQPVAWGPLTYAQYLHDTIQTPEPVVEASESAEACALDGQPAPSASQALRALAPQHAENSSISAWLDFAQDKIVGVTAFDALGTVADRLDQHLTLRSFVSGYAPSAADFALYGAIKGSVPFLGLIKRNMHIHLARHFAFFDALPSVKTAQSVFNAANKNKIKARTANASFELGLPNAQMGKVVTRFPPEPSGFLHIGHAKAAILNQYFAQHYQGKFIVRFDDTNPSKESEEFQDSILEDLLLMGLKGDAMSYTSNYFNELYDYALQMIKTGKAYTDDTAQEQMRAERMDGLPSAHRNDSVEDNLAHFEEMKQGTEAGLKWCLRAKISVDDPNKAMRDPVIYRCNLQPHHRTGTQWKIYPGYDFACPVVDCIEGVTHALRTNEYRDRNPQYWWMLEALGLRKVEVWDFGRLSFVYTLLSKRKLKAMVEEKGLVLGWDDPRFPTVRGIRRRGLTIDALRSFMLAQGPSQAQTSLEWDSIWTANKKVIDPIAPRFTAVAKQNLVKVTVAGAPPQAETKALPKHKKNPELGNKDTVYQEEILMEQEDVKSFGDNEEVTLMDWGNAYMRTKHNGEGGAVASVDAVLHLEGDFKKTEKKVHWLADVDSLVPVTLIDYDYLITKKRIEDTDEWTDYINKQTEFRTEALADANVASLKHGDIIQFERKGFFIVDRALNGGGKPGMDFVLIPDGRAASTALKGPSGDKPAVPKKAAAGAAGAKSGGAKGAASAATGLPVPAPNEVQTTTLLSNGDSGYEIPVTTKMYHVNPVMSSQPNTENASKMYKVNPVMD